MSDNAKTFRSASRDVRKITHSDEVTRYLTPLRTIASHGPLSLSEPPGGVGGWGGALIRRNNRGRFISGKGHFYLDLNSGIKSSSGEFSF